MNNDTNTFKNCLISILIADYNTKNEKILPFSF